MNQGEEFKVKGKGLDEDPRKGPLKGVAGEQFESGLGVADGQPEEDLDAPVVDGAHDAALPRVRDARIGMLFGADDDVDLLIVQDPEKFRNLAGRQIEVSV